MAVKVKSENDAAENASLLHLDKSPIPAITAHSREQKTPWRSIWIVNILQFLDGIQFSILFTSMWPYLLIVDKSATLDFYGWVIAIFPLGQTAASFLFGVWNQKTKRAKLPVVTGMTLMGIGNFLYGILPMFPHGQKYIMLVARFIVGFGAGNLSVLRSYVATAASAKDRTKAMSLGIGVFVLGVSLGPALMVVFTPLGEDGFKIGWFPVSMYNAPTFAMVIVSIISLIVLFTLFEESYAGIIHDKAAEGDSDKKTFTGVVVPKFDKVAAAACIFIWFVSQLSATNSEVLMVPLSMTLYNWSNEQAILWNGILVFISTAISFAVYTTIALTRVGKIDKRKVIVFGLIVFILYNLVLIPWPFYNGPLDYMPFLPNSTVEDTSKGGCFQKYKWCAHTSRVPLPVFIIAATLLVGISFPTICAPDGTLFAEVIGPRNQGFMQGLFALVGSLGRFVGPLVSTNLFDNFGYMAPMLVMAALLFLGIITAAVFRKHLVPLSLTPPVGVPTKYKNGTFYRL